MRTLGWLLLGVLVVWGFWWGVSAVIDVLTYGGF